jgi:hypothetical protein
MEAVRIVETVINANYMQTERRKSNALLRNRSGKLKLSEILLFQDAKWPYSLK